MPNCLKIIWVISKSLFLPVCRQFLVFVVCHISFPLAAYSLISGGAHSFVSCKMMPCLIRRFFFFSPPCLSCRVYTLLHLGNFPQKSVKIKKRKYFFFLLKFAYSASSWWNDNCVEISSDSVYASRHMKGYLWQWTLRSLLLWQQAAFFLSECSPSQPYAL